MNRTITSLIGAGIVITYFNATAQTASVETKAPNSTYAPAFAGQTRIGAVATGASYEGKVMTTELKRPWGIAALPDGRFIVTEKEGTMRLVSASGSVSEPLSGVLPVASAGQGGLLGICLDPSFGKNRMVYWAYSESVGEESVTSVAKGKLSADEKSLENVSTIYQAKPSFKNGLHFGARVLFGRDGSLFLSTGERADIITRPQAQDLSSALGKIIRITTDGKPAAGNPFADKAGARPEIYTYGHRNVQGIAVHPVTGELWDSEFGPRGGDEINRIVPGKNYGWPTITYGMEYRADKVGDGIQQKEGLEQPVYYWDPVISPSGMTFYSGKDVAEWRNNLFITALSGMHVCRLVIENNRVTGEERLLSGENQRFRDITEGVDGALYAITDQGRLYRIGRK
jgi:glucose/arabinose dehydrogenase